MFFLSRAVSLSVQSLRRSSMEFAQTGIPSQLGRSSFGHSLEFSQVWQLEIPQVLFTFLLGVSLSAK